MDKEQFQTLEKPNRKLHSKITTKSRLFFVLFLISSITIFFITNSFFNLRFTEITKREGQLNLTKNASNIVNELQKNSIIAQLLVNDQEITKALISKDFSLLSEKFARFIADISVASITLLDKNGNLVAFSAKENFEKKIKKLGFKTKIIEFKEKNFKPVKNLYARLGNKKPNFCFAGHLDVVPPGNIKHWTVNPFRPSVKKGHLIGRGANDMKSSIAAFVSAVSIFLSQNKKFNGSISLLITGDEEGDAVNGTKKVVEYLKKKKEKIMEYRKLGRTDIDVSTICLGTMTWGEQNTEVDAHDQLDYSLEQGVNFIDTAEMYAVPTKEKTQGLTEKYIGTWFQTRKNRDKVILATKVAGRSGLSYMRENNEMTRLSREHIHYAVDQSLKRLQTDYIDLYQVHWPERPFGAFSGKLEYRYAPIPEDTIDIEETLGALGELVQQGKVRHIGLSNETPWGTMKYLELSKTKSLPRVVSIQNAYNLINRAYEVGLSEVTNHEQVSLLSYSPLGQGILTGKYLNGQMPQGSRLALFGDGPLMYRYKRPSVNQATEKYVEIAKQFGIDPAQFAIRFCDIQQFMTSTIIGATTMDQLKTCISSVDIEITKEILNEIKKVHEEFPHPAP